jgi:hypothetical protein
MSDQIFYTQSLQDFLKSHLREDDKYPISKEQAEILSLLCPNDECIIYIQYPDEFSADNNIYLWHYKAWRYDYERQRRVSAYHHQERIKGNLFTANVELIAEGIVKKYRLDVDKARSMAWKWIKSGNKAAIEMVAGVTKLKEKEEEL